MRSGARRITVGAKVESRSKSSRTQIGRSDCIPQWPDQLWEIRTAQAEWKRVDPARIDNCVRHKKGVRRMAVRRTELGSFSRRELQREFSSVTEMEENSSPEAILDSLPKRQREVLALLMRGLSLKEVAKRLGISPHTVNDYTKALYRRFQVSGRSELLALFIADPIASGI